MKIKNTTTEPNSNAKLTSGISTAVTPCELILMTNYFEATELLFRDVDSESVRGFHKICL